MALEKELETYKQRLPTLLEDQGKYAVIWGDRLIGVYGDYEDALKAAYAECGTAPFLVKKIEATETINYFTRDLSEQCPT